MIPSEFSYVRATSLEDALRLLQEHDDDAKVVCGGHSLIPLMKLRLAAPSVLIDIRTLPELQGIEQEGDLLHIGAGVRHRDIERHPLIEQVAPLLARAASAIGDPQIRARGTIGGSTVHGDPAGDLLAALLAMDATATIASAEGLREVALADFFEGFWQTAIEPHEILTRISVRQAAGRPVSFHKFTQRAQDWAIVGVAILGGDRPQVALMNMAETPMRAHAVEEALAQGASAEEAAQLAHVGTTPPEDTKADAAYRQHLARVLTARALAEVA